MALAVGGRVQVPVCVIRVLLEATARVGHRLEKAVLVVLIGGRVLPWTLRRGERTGAGVIGEGDQHASVGLEHRPGLPERVVVLVRVCPTGCVGDRLRLAVVRSV